MVSTRRLGTRLALGIAALMAAGSTEAQVPRVPGAPPIRTLAPAGAPADGQQKKKDPDVPPAYRPAPGMCRIWLNGVPPSQQPAPTDCASAVRNRPANGRVLFGDDYVERKSGSVRDGVRFLADATPTATTVGSWRLVTVRGPNPGLDDEAGSDSPIVGRGVADPADTASEAGAPLAVVAPRAAEPRASAPRPPATRGGDPDEYEAGYAAGYRDAMNGRRPRFSGVDRSDPRAGYAAPGYAGPGYGPPTDPDLGHVVSPSGGTSGRYLPYGTGVGGAVVVPGGDDPRYFNNGRYAPPGRANGICLDRDGDGWCDDPRYGPAVCRDLDHDGRCDDYPALAGAAYPSALPDMRAGTDVRDGRGSATALRWLGTAEVVARLVNPNRTGTPYRVLWYDANSNALLQAWTDLDGDGIADRVEIFRNGRRVKLLGR